MPTYGVAASNKDGWAGTNGPSTTDTVLRAEQSRLLDPDLVRYGWAKIDTSPIGTDEISAATLWWYTESCIKSPKSETFDHYIQIVGGGAIYASTVQEAAGWKSHALGAGELSLINKTGETEIMFAQNLPTLPDGGRTWLIRSWDYTPNGTYSVYLVVTHAAAGGPTKMTILGV